MEGIMHEQPSLILISVSLFCVHNKQVSIHSCGTFLIASLLLSISAFSLLSLCHFYHHFQSQPGSV